MPISTYVNNIGGIDISSSPLSSKDNQATGQSYNYEYATTGAISKVLAPMLVNSLVSTQLVTLGLGRHHDATTDARTVVRCADTKIQTVDLAGGTFTNLSEDTTAATTNFLATGSTQPVVFSTFNTPAAGTQTWMAGGGLSTIVGYNGTKITQNGVAAPTGSVTPTVNPAAGGTWNATGTYFYAFQFRKASTQTYSNLSLDVSATIAGVTDTVTLPLTGITNNDTVKYDKIRIWRSAVSGVTGFTVGDLVAELNSTATTYTDTGTSVVDTQNVPRAGNTLKDNSQLPSGTYKSIASFKRRLVTAKDSTIYLSDLNLPESWPLENTITIPSGGPITALGVIGVPSEYTTGADEYLCVWKESELWVLTGNNASEWTLLFVDKTGCAGQSLVVQFNSFVGWMTYNGIFLWDGRGRPARVSRPLLSLFAEDGDIDKTKLARGYACLYAKGNQVIWRVSHRTLGFNKLSIKMDTRLTSLAAAQNLQNPEMDGVFILDNDNNSYTALCSFQPSNKDEKLLSGDNAGYIYDMYKSASTAVDFTYETKPFDMGAPEVLKRFKRVLVYVERLVDKDLTMKFWVDYRSRDEYSSETVVSLAPARGTLPALWDIAVFDQSLWDDYTPDISPVEFNVHSFENNAEGVTLKLRFEQAEAAAPVRIHGFMIEWEPIGNLPVPTQQIS